MAVDDRKKSKSRFSLFLVLSLIVHTGGMLWLYWSPILIVKPKSFDPDKKTVIIKMAPEKKTEEKKEDQPEEKKKEEDKKDPKKENEQQKQQKQQEQKKQEQKKQEQQKQEQQKQSQQKQTQQQSEDAASGKSSESNKSASKDGGKEKSEPSKSGKKADGKDRPKKGEPGKGEPAKGEPSKGEPGKGQPSKGQPSKGEPSKGEPAKGEPQKGEPTKQQAKPSPDKEAPTKQQDKKKSRREENPEFGLDYGDYQKPGVDMPEGDNKKPGVPGEDPNNLAYWTKRLGNVRQLNESAMQRSIVVTEGASEALDRRTQQGLATVETLTPQQKQEFNRVLNDNVGKVLQNYVAPKKDGKKYYGEIRFTVDAQGFIDQANFKIRSGNDQLDQAVLNALIATRKLDLSADSYVSHAVTMFPMVFYYSDEDME